jgi:DNA polymerase-3 subunit beta
MRFTVQRPALLEKLERAKGIAARKPTIPILSHVKFSLAYDALKLAVTDLDVTYRGTVSAISGQGDYEFCLPAQKLFEIIKAMPENEILFEMEPSSNKCAVSSGKAKFRLATSPVDNFPNTEWPQFNDSSVDVLSLSFDAHNLRYGLLQTIYASTQEASRFTLQNLQFRQNGEDAVDITGTDGHRMARITIPCQIEGDAFGGQFMVTAKALQNWLSIKPQGEATPVKISAIKQAIRLEAGDHGTFYFRVIDGQFPNTAMVFEAIKQNFLQYQLDPKVATQALQRALLVADDRSNAVRLLFKDGSLTISAETSESGASQEDVAIEQVAGAPDEVTIGLNGGYLVDFLSRQEDPVKVWVGTPNSAVYFTTGAISAVIMPLRI